MAMLKSLCHCPKYVTLDRDKTLLNNLICIHFSQHSFWADSKCAAFGQDENLVCKLVTQWNAMPKQTEWVV